VQGRARGAEALGQHAGKDRDGDRGERRETEQHPGEHGRRQEANDTMKHQAAHGLPAVPVRRGREPQR
jgi:hypothetical protein